MENFSVLLSLYYKEKPEYVKQALDSILTQTVKSNDVVICEDGPLTPELDALLEEYEQKYPEINIVKFPKNRGLGFALNDGLLECKNDLVARSDADDINMPFRFEEELKVFAEHPDYSMVSSWIDEFWTTPDKVVSQRRLPETPEENYIFGKKRCPVNHPTVMFKKSAVLKVGGYQTDYFPEDYYLWCKMLNDGCKIYNIQKSLLWFRSSMDTYKKRGGWKYACDEAITQWKIYKMGYISFPRYCTNVIIRFTTRIMPNSVRGGIYKIIRKFTN